MTPDTPLPTRTILVVDDNESDRQAAIRFLRRDREHAYTFIECELGEDGLTQFHEDGFDCVLLDHRLPDMTGLDFLAELSGKAERPRCAIVMMTGAGSEALAVQAIKDGAQDYIVKSSLSPELLLVAVDNAIEKVRLLNHVAAQQERLERQNAELQARQIEIEALNRKMQRAMAESHHRIKNNLQVLAALVNLTVSQQDGDIVPASALRRMEQHIRTLAALHDMLTQEAKGDADMDLISLQAALEKLAPMLEQTTGGRTICITAEEVQTSSKQASAFLLLVNELISNAVKHGRGAVEVTLSVPDGKARLTVCDDGPGFPAGFHPLLAANTGLELIETIGRLDLRGEVVYENRPEGGARVAVTFPLPDPALSSAISASQNGISAFCHEADSPSATPGEEG